MSINKGLPDEPVNVILEDPTDENILYAGGLRGVYLSKDRGKTWAYLGNNLPTAAVADLEIHEGKMDLVVATHGRGIYKINLLPIHAMISKNLPKDMDHLFDIPESKRPAFSSHSGEVLPQTVEKTSISFWLSAAKSITLSLRDKDNKIFWTTTLQGQKGLNEYRWDMIVKKEESNKPYFVHYDQYLEAGNYTLLLSDGTSILDKVFIVKDETPSNK
jgi:methionine-rich copper-binding protein CopC